MQIECRRERVGLVRCQVSINWNALTTLFIAFLSGSQYKCVRNNSQRRERGVFTKYAVVFNSMVSPLRVVHGSR